MTLNTDHYARCISTLEMALERLNAAERESIDFEIFRNEGAQKGRGAQKGQSSTIDNIPKK